MTRRLGTQSMLACLLVSAAMGQATSERTVTTVAELQSALAAGGKIHVLTGRWDYYVPPLTIHGDTTLRLDPGVVIIAERGQFHGERDCLFTAQSARNVVIRGYGATLRMWGREYCDPKRYQPSEWRHGIWAASVENLTIEGVTIENSGGSGICLGHDWQHNSREPCRNVTIRDVTSDGNYREGIFVGDAVGLTIDNCVLRNTAGHSTQAGIDLEPDYASSQLDDVTIRDCRIYGNNGPAIAIWLVRLNATSLAPHVNVENCWAYGNRMVPFVVSTNELPGAAIQVTGCTFDHYADFSAPQQPALSMQRCNWRTAGKEVRRIDMAPPGNPVGK